MDESTENDDVSSEDPIRESGVFGYVEFDSDSGGKFYHGEASFGGRPQYVEGVFAVSADQ